MTPVHALLSKAAESLGAARLLADAGYHDLIEGQDSRNIGDYDLAGRLGGNESEQQLHRAEEFLAFAKTFLAND